MGPALTPLSSTAKGTKALRTMVMDLRELFVQGSLHRAATTFPARSKSRFVRLMSTDIARNSPTSSPSLEEQNCHFEPKKICELEMKTRPKKAKKYSYTKDCKEQPREICDQCEKK